MCRKIANSRNLPIIRSRNVFVILYRSDTVYKRAVSSVIDVENGSSSELDDLCHHVHHYVALRTQLDAIADLRIAGVGQHLFVQLVR